MLPVPWTWSTYLLLTLLLRYCYQELNNHLSRWVGIQFFILKYCCLQGMVTYIWFLTLLLILIISIISYTWYQIRAKVHSVHIILWFSLIFFDFLWFSLIFNEIFWILIILSYSFIFFIFFYILSYSFIFFSLFVFFHILSYSLS